MSSPPAGLCDSCLHQKVIANTRGSSFSLCERSKDDERFPKYPRVPVRECWGFAPSGEESGSRAGAQSEPDASGE